MSLKKKVLGTVALSLSLTLSVSLSFHSLVFNLISVDCGAARKLYGVAPSVTGVGVLLRTVGLSSCCVVIDWLSCSF